MALKRFLCFLLIISFVVTLNACGCEHEWTEATCEAPRTCTLCGDTEGELGEHDFAEASCITPKKCKVCGTVEGEALGHDFAEADCVTPKKCKVCSGVEGEALGHNFSEADCDTPKMCIVCGTTEGTALGHKYTSGYCEQCGSADPDYQALRDYGFSNMNGMNVWLQILSDYDQGFSPEKIKVYDLDEKCIYISSFRFTVFQNGSFRSGSVSASNLQSLSYVTPEVIGLGSAKPYKIVSNDVISYSGFGEGTKTINKRYIDSDNSCMVLEVIEGDFWDHDTTWYVPADMIDFSTMEVYDISTIKGSDSSTTVYKINFK